MEGALGVDYSKILSSEIIDFIKETASFYPPDLDPLDWMRQRAVYNQMAEHFHAGRPNGLRVQDGWVGSVRVRYYGEDTEVTVLYFHGGGFVLGGLESHDDVCAEIASRTGLRVVSVDYRLAPENPHPAAYEDAILVAEALSKESRLVLCGDSAGGTLCATLSGTRHDLGFKGQVLIYPMLGYPAEGGSFETHAEAPLLTTADLKIYASVRGGDPDDPRLIPIKGDLENLPSTWLFPAECDPLCDDAVRFASDSKAKVIVQKGLVHGWLRARGCNEIARSAFSQIIDAIRRAAA